MQASLLDYAKRLKSGESKWPKALLDLESYNEKHADEKKQNEFLLQNV